jgi:hypothetical protein
VVGEKQPGNRALTQGAIITRIFASGTSAIKMDLADATHVVLRDVPAPSCYGLPLFNRDFHSVLKLGAAWSPVWLWLLRSVAVIS